MSRSIRWFAAPALALALALLLPSCGDDDDGDEADTDDTSTTTTVPDESTTSTAPTTSETTASTAPATTGTDGVDPMTDADTEPKSGEAEDGMTLLVDVRTGRHEGFDRITFEFDGPLPGYLVEYVDPPIIEDGSGDTVPVLGNAFLSMRFEPASGYDMEAGEESYTGPDTVEGNGTSELIEVVKTGDFEAVLNWVAGLEDEVDFRVTTLSDPSRVVVDVRNH